MGFTMMLITKEIASKLPRLYETEMLEPENIKVPLKLFNPCGVGTWYVTEYDPDSGEMFGWADLGDPMCAELGYLPTLDEFKSMRLPFGLSIERDRHWDSNTTLRQVMNGERS